MTARVTVAIPTYNRSALLADTIRSVLSQSMSDIEVIVSDNASTDDTPQVVAEFRDPRLLYVCSTENRGHFWNLSRSLHLGSAPYLTVLCDDDVMLPGHLEATVAVLDEHPEVDLVASGIRRLCKDAGGTVLADDVMHTAGQEDWNAPGSDVLRRLLTTRCSLPYVATLMRRSVVGDDEGFAAEDKGADDVGLMLRLARRASRIAYLQRPGVVVAVHPSGANAVAGGCERVGAEFAATLQSARHVFEAKQRFLDRFGDELPDHEQLARNVRGLYASELVGIVRLHLRAGEPLPSVGRLLAEAVRANPQILLRRDTLNLVRDVAAMQSRRHEPAASGPRK